MKTTSSQLKAYARANLSGRYAVPIIAYMAAQLLLDIPSTLVSYMTGTATSAAFLLQAGVALILSCLSAVFFVGFNHILLRYGRSPEIVPVSAMWYGFTTRTNDSIIAYFCIFARCFVCALPSVLLSVLYIRTSNAAVLYALIPVLLFTVPVVVKIDLDYALVFYLILDEPALSPKELLAKSRELMTGSRCRLLYLRLSFLGLQLLSLLSFSLASFWVYPYMQMTLTAFYLDLCKREEIILPHAAS